ncbi:hypothetical protein SOHN41_03966 [Shewanella sp. HN-41]|nr:hypothetical protein SOHN41_03966 [Shewanella sp. HN-41]
MGIFRISFSRFMRSISRLSAWISIYSGVIGEALGASPWRSI